MPSRNQSRRQAHKRREKLRIEQLEARCVMDGAGFVSDFVRLEGAMGVADVDEAIFVGGHYLIDVGRNPGIAIDYVNWPILDPIRLPPSWGSNAYFTVFEGASEQRLDVLQNHPLADPLIVSVSETRLGGSVRVSEGGDAVWYEPPPNAIGADSFRYTVRGGDGIESAFQVTVSLTRPYQWVQSGDAAYIDARVGPVVIDPLANDNRLNPELPEARIESFSLPEHAGSLTLLEDGRRLLYEPAEGFNGAFTLQYAIRYGDGRHQTIDASLQVEVAPQFLAVENWFEVEADATDPTRLDVLANDPLLRPFRNRPDSHYRDTQQAVSLEIVSVSAGSRGGTIEVSDDGAAVTYTPAEGFVGNETFTYEVESTSGVRETALVTVRVSDGPGANTGYFSSVGEFRQILIDRAVAQYAQQFGRYDSTPATSEYGLPRFVSYEGVAVAFNAANDATFQFQPVELDHSATNVQVAGVDEADIVETDGRYVYTLSGGQLAIIDLIDPDNPQVVSLSQFQGSYQQMYLQGDRLTLLRLGSNGGNAEVVVLDISDRSEPTLVERTKINGAIIDSRAIGDKVGLVVQNAFDLSSIALPPLAKVEVESGVTRNETLGEYLGRIRDGLTHDVLPSYRAYGPDGELTSAGLLARVSDLRKALAGGVVIVSVVTLDAGDDSPGPVAPPVSFVSSKDTEVYVSATSAYIFSFNQVENATTVTKLALRANGRTPIVATGVIPGRVLNQFAADEHDGMLRVVTSGEFELQERTWDGFTYTRTVRASNLFVLEQHGRNLEIVGKIEHFAQFDFLKSVRFAGDRAYAVTFRVVDPLFSIDLSDPTNPTLRGELTIPGFSDYLQPIGEDYLLAIGRYAFGTAEVNGGAAPLQITLFNVADLDNPIVAAQLTYARSLKTSTEAWTEHHAVAYFPETGVLALPVTWFGAAGLDEDEGEIVAFMGAAKAESWTADPEPSEDETAIRRRSGVWTFQIDTESPGWPTIQQTGSIEHPSSGLPGTPAVRRALRIGESLVTVSDHHLQVNDLNQPNRQIGKTYIGPIAWDDLFTVQEESGAGPLEVLKNDRPGSGGEVLPIAAVSQPLEGGVAAIAEDGRSLLFTPYEDFFGQVQFTYTVIDPVRGEQTASVWVRVENTPDAPTAVDDAIEVAANSGHTLLNLLGNDMDPDARAYGAAAGFVGSSTMRVYVDDLSSMTGGLMIAEIGPTDQGGKIERGYNGQVYYTPAAGFSGVETFTYTIANQSGFTSTATVSITVVAPPAEEPGEALPVAEGLPTTSARAAAAVALSTGSPIEAATVIEPVVQRAKLPARAAVFTSTPASPARFMRLDAVFELHGFHAGGPAEDVLSLVEQEASETDDAVDNAFAALGSDLNLSVKC